MRQGLQLQQAMSKLWYYTKQQGLWSFKASSSGGQPAGEGDAEGEVPQPRGKLNIRKRLEEPFEPFTQDYSDF